MNPLSIEGVPGLSEALDKALADATRDVIERPTVTKGRKVTVVIEVTPHVVDTALSRANYPLIKGDVKLSVPGVTCLPIHGKVDGDRILVSPSGEKNPDQARLNSKTAGTRASLRG